MLHASYWAQEMVIGHELEVYTNKNISHIQVQILQTKPSLIRRKTCKFVVLNIWTGPTRLSVHTFRNMVTWATSTHPVVKLPNLGWVTFCHCFVLTSWWVTLHKNLHVLKPSKTNIKMPIANTIFGKLSIRGLILKTTLTVVIFSIGFWRHIANIFSY